MSTQCPPLYWTNLELQTSDRTKCPVCPPCPYIFIIEEYIIYIKKYIFSLNIIIEKRWTNWTFEAMIDLQLEKCPVWGGHCLDIAWTFINKPFIPILTIRPSNLYHVRDRAYIYTKIIYNE